MVESASSQSSVVPPPAARGEATADQSAEIVQIAQLAQFRTEGPVAVPGGLGPPGAQRGATIGRVEATNGEVIVSRVDQTNQVLKPGDPIFQGDIIATRSGGAQVSFSDGTVGHLGANSRMLVQEFATGIGSPAPVVFVISGPFSFASPPGGVIAANALTVRTPVASVRLEGGRLVGRAAPEAVENRFTLVRNFDGTLGRAVIATAGATYVLQNELASAQVVSLFREPTPLSPQSIAQVEASLGGSVFDWIATPAAGTQPDPLQVADAANSAGLPPVGAVTPAFSGDGTGRLGGGGDGAAFPTFGTLGNGLSGDRSFGSRPPEIAPRAAGLPRAEAAGDPNTTQVLAPTGGQTVEVLGGTVPNTVDTLVVNFANTSAANIVSITQVNGKVVIDVGGGNTLNADNFEELQLNLGSGNDDITIGDLSATTILNSTVRLNLGGGDDTADASNAGKRHVMRGESGNDTLTGSSQGDELDGGTGADSMTGKGGDDTYIVDDAGDTVTEAVGEGTDEVKSSISFTLPANVENLTLTGSSNINGTGNTLANTLVGNSGNNTLDGGSGADSMSGGAGNDTYVVDNAGDTVTESAGGGTDTVQSGVTFTLGANIENLTLTGSSNINGTGNALNNTLTGNSGNNTLDGGTGADSMSGGGGDDTYVVDNAGDTVTENASEGTDTVQSSVTFTLGANVEHLTLTGSANINGTGNALDNTLTGNSGNNTLDGGAGADSMSGGAGNDTYVVDNASDTVTENASEGTDTVQSSVTYTISDADVENLTLTGSSNIDGTGNASANTITGNSGNNVLAGLGGGDTIDGGGGTDTVSYAASASAVTVNLATNTHSGGDAQGDSLSNIENITGSAHNDTLTGDGGANVIAGGAGGDTIDGGGGTDTVSYAASASAVTVNLATNTHSGGDAQGDSLTGIENITGSAHNDTLTGDTGQNVIDGGAGADSMSGGAGNDTYVVDNVSDTVTENASEGTDTVQSSVTFTLSSNVEHLTLTGSADINGTGNTLDNTLTGNSGINTLTGGAGNDTYIVQNTGDTVVELAAEGTDTVQSSVSYTISDADVENLTLTGSTNIDGTGNASNNTITGNSGNNVLAGLGGADTIDGGAGTDTVTYGASASAVTVNLATNTHSGGDAQGDSLSNIENVTGSANDDSLTGSSGADVLNGGSGNDTLDGGAGNDTLTGGTGNDAFVFNTGYGNDTISDFSVAADQINLSALTPGTFTDVLNATADSGSNAVISIGGGTITLTGVSKASLTSGNFVLTSNTATGGDDTLTGTSGNDTIDGGSGSDTIDGFGGNDTLKGGPGNDKLIGGAGDDDLQGEVSNDILYGGAGTDTLSGGSGSDDFYYAATSEGGDTVTDFTSGQDEFVFLQSAFGNLPTGTLSASNFATVAGTYNNSGGATTGTPGFIFDSANGVLTYDADGNGGAAGFTIATLSSGSVAAGDIQITATSPV
jgi:Ca2+-binding RTX toxin-like protein